VKWTASPNAVRETAEGSVVDVELRAEVEPGWKLYSLTQKGGGPTPMSVKLSDSTNFQIAGTVIGPQPVRSMDPNFNLETETYAGNPVFRVSVKLPRHAKPVDLKVRSQACSDRLCLPARTTTITVDPGKSGS
jgi:thiol:disulfide interchange protein DsbD